MSLKNKLTEEEAKELIEFLDCGDKPENFSKECIQEKDCLDCKIKYLKKSGIIRKSPLEEAREKTDEYIRNISHIELLPIHTNDYKSFGNREYLRKIIQSEREAK